MSKLMKIMIAYDGSGYSEAAINDLRFAGLPREGEAFVVSVQDSIPPASLSNIEMIEKAASSRRILSTVALLQEQTAETFKHLRESVAAAAENVKLYLPEWEIEGKALVGTPSQTLLEEAGFLRPDLIVAGSHGRTAFGRFFLGSVSNEIANKAACAVRIVRGSATENINGNPRVILPIDESPETEAVVRHIGSRVWSDETEIRLAVIDDEFASPKTAGVLSKKQLTLEWAIEQLEAINLKVSIAFTSDDMKTALLEEASRWNANSIFVAAKRSGEKGNVDESVMEIVNSANCPVEIVR